MLSIFSVPKPFTGHIGVIQRNAIQSWTRLHPSCEIILCGDEPGTGGIAAEFKVRWIPDVVCNEYGTPLLNSVFDQVQETASHRYMCYVNADVILMKDFIESVERIPLEKFLVVGQRWDVDLTTPWDFEHMDWEDRLRRYVTNHGVLHAPWGSDYFVFPRDSVIGKLPEFAVGRAGWDNWLIFRARKLGIPVIDVTKAVTVVHQNHDYGHVPDSKGYRTGGAEADWNIKLAGNASCHRFNLFDATHVMTSRAMAPALGYTYLRRRLRTLPILSPGTRPFVRVINLVGTVIKRLGKAVLYQKKC